MRSHYPDICLSARYDWNEHERSVDPVSLTEEPFQVSSSFPSVMRSSIRTEPFSRRDIKTTGTSTNTRKVTPLIERQVLVTRKSAAESTTVPPTSSTPVSSKTKLNEQSSQATSTLSAQIPTTRATTRVTETPVTRSPQVPTESITQIMKMLRRRKPIGLFENRLAHVRENRMKLLARARGKPKKRVPLKFST